MRSGRALSHLHLAFLIVLASPVVFALLIILALSIILVLFIIPASSIVLPLATVKVPQCLLIYLLALLELVRLGWVCPLLGLHLVSSLQSLLEFALKQQLGRID